ncbi:MAG: response regulator [Planctomycetota bacterium]
MASILVVDDSTLTRSIVRLALRAEGHTVTEARDGIEGIRVAEQLHPDLVIAGLTLPALGGVEMLRDLRDASADAPFVVLSEPVTQGTRDQCTALGVVAMLDRPVDGTMLRKTIGAALPQA